jgi:hypothetical protein
LTGQGLFVTQTAPLTPPVSLIELATEYPELAEILGDPKLDSAYKDFLIAYQSGGSKTALELARQRGLLNANGDLRLTLELDTEESGPLQRELEENGIHVTAVSGNLMDVAVPLGLLERLMAAGTADNLLVTITNLDHVVRIRLPQVDVHDDRTEQDTPAASPPALGTPPAVTPSATPPGVAAGLLRANWFMLGLGVLLCVVAPLLLGLGVYLLISGLGFSRRKRAAPDVLPLPDGEPGAGRAILSGEAAPSTRLSSQEPLPPAGPAPATSAVTPPEEARANRPAAMTVGQTGDRQTPPVAPRPQPPVASPVETIPCRRCGYLNRAGATFCASCGASLQDAASPPVSSLPTLVGTPTPQPPAPAPDAAPVERPTYCWNCGQRLRPTSQFCPYCGDRI